MNYHYEYVKISIEDVVQVYKNEVKTDQKFVLTNDVLTPNVLRNLIKGYDEIVKQQGLDPIKPSKGKGFKQLQARRQGIIDELQQLNCFKCPKLSYHLT